MPATSGDGRDCLECRVVGTACLTASGEGKVELTTAEALRHVHTFASSSFFSSLLYTHKHGASLPCLTLPLKCLHACCEFLLVERERPHLRPFLFSFRFVCPQVAIFSISDIACLWLSLDIARFFSRLAQVKKQKDRPHSESYLLFLSHSQPCCTFF